MSSYRVQSLSESQYNVNVSPLVVLLTMARPPFLQGNIIFRSKLLYVSATHDFWDTSC